MKEQIKFWLKSLMALFVSYPIIPIVLICAFFAAMIIGGVRSGCLNRKKEKIEANIQSGKFEANVISNKIYEQEQNTNGAQANYNSVFNVDSGNRESNFSAVKRKWCAEHANDSKCR